MKSRGVVFHLVPHYVVLFVHVCTLSFPKCFFTILCALHLLSYSDYYSRVIFYIVVYLYCKKDVA